MSKEGLEKIRRMLRAVGLDTELGPDVIWIPRLSVYVSDSWDHHPSCIICQDVDNPFSIFYFLQQLFQYRMKHRVHSMSGEGRVKYIKEHALKLFCEIPEVMNEVPWKSHKTYPSLEIPNRIKYLREWMDCQAFMFNLLAAVNPTPLEILNAVEFTVEKNFRRHDGGYAGPIGEDITGQPEDGADTAQ
ncbi:hypothetical protein KKH23_09970 [Patescibacteria group bacterium]|nr:hypothetical protein [Patescibacteria group bacterium]